jgi:hypothetical protein
VGAASSVEASLTRRFQLGTTDEAAWTGLQVADAVAYVYRRNLELKSEAEAWEGETAYYEELATKLDGTRERLGSNREGPCVDFYRAVKCKHWTL